jgi:hypothetical protein
MKTIVFWPWTTNFVMSKGPKSTVAEVSTTALALAAATFATTEHSDKLPTVIEDLHV